MVIDLFTAGAAGKQLPRIIPATVQRSFFWRRTRYDAPGRARQIGWEVAEQKQRDEEIAASIDAAVDAAADNKADAINRFMEAEFALIDAFQKEDRLSQLDKREGDREYDEAANAIDGAHAAREKALDELIEAEFAFRSASKAWDKHYGALAIANAVRASKRLQ
jgi:hypothetical protein